MSVSRSSPSCAVNRQPFECRPASVERCILELAEVLRRDDPGIAAWAASALGPLGLAGCFEASTLALLALRQGLTSSGSACCRRCCADSLALLEWRVDGHAPSVLNADHASDVLVHLANALETETDDTVCAAIIDAMSVHAGANYFLTERSLRSFSQRRIGWISRHASEALTSLTERD